ncbi:MAG: hypothetical protein KTR31_35070 [Myxococcales bacterium]|nr:hypothetical protein [Myxococcales bacterium]
MTTRLMLALGAALLLGACGDDDDDDDDDTVILPAEPLDPGVAAVTDGDWWRPRMRTSWHWTLSQPVDTSVAADLVVVDLAAVQPTDVQALHTAGHRVACTLGGITDSRTMRSQLAAASDAGCDAIGAVDFGAPEAEHLALHRNLYNEARTLGMAALHWASSVPVAEVVDYADAAVALGCHQAETCGDYDAFGLVDKPLLVAEHEGLAATDPALLCRTALIAQTRTVVLSPEQDATELSCDTSFPSTTRLADVQQYVTYYGRDAQRIDELATLDLAIVQPLLTPDQRLALKANAQVAVYLSIGEIGLSNTYLIDGEEQLGQVVYDAHPEWFLGKNPFFDSWFADTTEKGWQDFVLDQAEQLLDQGYDGLFLDTVDTVDVFPETIPGMVRLIERLRENHPSAVLIQNRGMNVIPMSGPVVDALMFEVFSSTFNFDQQTYVRTDVGAPGYPEIVQKAVDYRLTGGVVLAQDFALPGGSFDDLICYAHERGLRHLFVPSYSDKFFQDGRFAYPDACPWPEAPRVKLDLQPRVAHVSRGRTVEIEIGDGSEYPGISPLDVSLDSSPSQVTSTLLDDTIEPGQTALVSLSAGAGAPTGVQSAQLSVPGHPSATADLQVVVHHETIWVTNAGLSNVVAFDEPSQLPSNAAPSRVTGEVVSQPYDIVVDDDGHQWVVENVGDPTATQPAGRLLRYRPFDLSTPDLVIDEGLNYPTGAAIADDGALWVVNSALDWTGTPRGTPDVSRVAPTASSATLAFRYDQTVYGWPLRITFDGSGDVYVATTYGIVLGFPPVQTGSEIVPDAVIVGFDGGGNEAWDTVRGLVFDGSGNLWLAASLQGNGRVVQLGAGSWPTDGSLAFFDQGDLGALITSGLYQPWGLQLDAAGRLWVVNATDADDGGNSRGSLLSFDSPVSGAVPSQEIPLASRYTLGLAVARP